MSDLNPSNPQSTSESASPKPPAPSTPIARRVYPNDLVNAEAALVRQRRKFNQPETGEKDAEKKDPVGEDARRVIHDSYGLAFSGGGIRSATFCLGVVQVLAKRGLLKKFDLLSTVSGGGYCGSFIGKLIQARGGKETAYADLQDTQSAPLRWLRESGYYLAPGGGADAWTIFSLLLRNWVAVHFVLGTFLALPFLLGSTLRRWLWTSDGWSELEKYFIPGLDFQPWPPVPGWDSIGFACSPWFLLVAVVFLVGMLIPGILYWSADWFGDLRFQEKQQGYYTHWLAFGSMLTAGLVLVAAMDTAGIWTYYELKKSPSFGAALGSLYAVAIAGFGLVQRFAGKLTALAAQPGKSPSMWTIAKIAGLIWAFLFWLILAVLGQVALWWGAKRGETGNPFNSDNMLTLSSRWSHLLIFTVLAGIVVWLLAQVFSFVNLSSLHQYYSTRLSRAYLGASNTARAEENAPVSESHKDDDCTWRHYAPHCRGGPLHLINVTLNETMSGKSQIEQIDRKGLAFALGPAGLSVGGAYHALWVDKDGQAVPNSPPTDTAGNPIPTPPSKIKAILPDGEDPSNPNADFHVFPLNPRKKFAGNADNVINVEELQLGDWVGISGAAFSTGMGAQTSLGLSLLLGFANIRLGYWWDSGIPPHSRSAPSARRRSLKLGQFVSGLFPVPCSILDELLTRFHGPARRYWYLSDGGHYENTACYELLRRRVGFILCLDCGQDDGMTFEDVGGLIRKARIDFNAEVEFVEGKEADATLDAHLVPPKLAGIDPKWIGLPGEFTSIVATDGKPILKSGERHAMLARVRYDGKPEVGTVILFLKPSLNDDEPLDVRQYHAANPDFPQQTTMDQFFDESQWESYRRLGEHIAELVIPK